MRLFSCTLWFASHLYHIRHPLRSCKSWRDVYFMVVIKMFIFAVKLFSTATAGTFLLCERNRWLELRAVAYYCLWEGIVWCVCFCFWCVWMSGRHHLILLISGLMSQRVLYRPVLMMIVKTWCVCVGGGALVWGACGYTCWPVCLLQEWSLLLITGRNLVI